MRQLLDAHSRGAGDVWQLRESAGLPTVLTVESLGCTLSLSDVYSKVSFPPPKSVPTSA